MNLNFAEKLGIFLGAITLTFALGIAACSPLAPSVEKNKLSTRNIHTGGEGATVTPNPAPNGLHLLFSRNRGEPTMIVGKDGYDWYFRSLSKNSQSFMLSAESLPGPLEEFKREGRVEIPLQPSTDWAPSPSGSYSGSVSFQLDLTSGNLTPAQLQDFDAELTPPSASQVRRALERHSVVHWTLQIKEGVDSDTRAVFLGALDAIRITVNAKETPVTAVSPVPAPNSELTDQDSDL